MDNTLPPLPKPPKLPERPTEGIAATIYDIADALRYPVDTHGRIYDVRFLMPVLAYHLARTGCVIDPERALIKPRKLPPAPGVIEDAIEWVPMSAPDTVEDELTGVTLDDIDRLSPTARAALIRRLGGQAPDFGQNIDPDAQTPWHVETSIHLDQED